MITLNNYRKRLIYIYYLLLGKQVEMSLSIEKLPIDLLLSHSLLKYCIIVLWIIIN